MGADMTILALPVRRVNVMATMTVWIEHPNGVSMTRSVSKEGVYRIQWPERFDLDNVTLAELTDRESGDNIQEFVESVEETVARFSNLVYEGDLSYDTEISLFIKEIEQEQVKIDNDAEEVYYVLRRMVEERFGSAAADRADDSLSVAAEEIAEAN